MKGKTVLLTGVTGFIGSHTAIQLLNKGYRVIGTLRSMKRADEIRQVIAKHTDHIEALSFHQANLTTPEDWPAAMEGVDFVQHIASPIPAELPHNPDDLIIPAREGTLNVLRAAAGAGVKRVVMTSSVAAIVYGKRKEGTFTEADWSDPDNLKDNTSYTRSKTLAEMAAWEFISAEGNGMEFSTVHPGGVLGPVLEKDFGTSAVMVVKLLDGSMPAFPKIGFPIVDVRSVADLHIRAMESPKAAGERFLCGVEYFTMAEVAEVLRKAYPERQISTRTLPDLLLKVMAVFMPVLRQTVHELGSRRVPDNSKARELLAWEHIPPEEAILATAESLFEQGILKK